MTLDYQTIFKELNKESIDYLVVGGLAVNFHGIPRMTYDIDLMVSLDSANIMRIVSKLANWGYRPRAPVKPEHLADKEKRDNWIKEKGMKAFSFYNENEAIGEIDLIIDSPIPYNELKGRQIKLTVSGTYIPVISIRDLIELKIQAGRKQDLSDAEHLTAILEQ